MPTEREILKYELDLTEFEAKSARMVQLVEQLKAKRTAGEGSTEVEAQLGKEIEGFGRLVPAEKKTQDATEELIHSKRKLAAVVEMLGGSFGPVVGRLGEIADLLLSAGGGAAAFAGALAGVTALIGGFQALEAHSRQYLKDLRDIQDAWEKVKSTAGAAEAERMAPVEAGLAKRDALTDENKKRALKTDAALRSTYGWKVDPEILAQATSEGITAPEEVASVDLLHRGGAPLPEGPRSIETFLRKARASGPQSAALEAARNQIKAWAGSSEGQQTISDTSQDQRTRDQLAGDTAQRPFDKFFKSLQTTGGLPQGVSTQAEYQAWLDKDKSHRVEHREAYGRFEEATRRGDELAGSAQPPGETIDMGQVFPPAKKPDEHPMLVPSEHAFERGPVAPTIINNYYDTKSIGTQFNNQGDRRGSDLRTKFGLNSEVDIVAPG